MGQLKSAPFKNILSSSSTEYSVYQEKRDFVQSGFTCLTYKIHVQVDEGSFTENDEDGVAELPIPQYVLIDMSLVESV